MKYTEEDIKPFTDACQDMINSKFILIDKRIGNILKAIATTKPVYNAIAEAMINFNWVTTYKQATQKTGELILPEEANKTIAFVFCLLKNIDSGNVNVSDLLVKYCSADEDRRSSYVVFCEKTIVPFKKLLTEKLVGTKAKPAVTDAPKLSLNNEVNERLAFLVKDVKAYTMGLKKIKASNLTKQEYVDLLDIFMLAIKNKDDKYYNAFSTTLFSVSGKDKELKNRLGAIIKLITHIKE